MTKTLPLAFVALGVMTPSAYAIDWSVRSTLSQTLEASDNRKLVPSPPGPSYSSVSSLLFDVTGRTPTSTFNVNGDLTYNAYAGAGEADTPNALNKSFNASYAERGKTTSYDIMVSRSQSETSQLQLEETGIATLTGTTTATSIKGGLVHNLNPRDSIAWQTSYSTSEFTGSSVAPFNSLSTSLNLTHRANPLTALTSSVQYQKLIFNSATQSDTTIWQATMGMQTQLTQYLSIQGSVGGTLREGGAALASGSGAGLIYDASVNYRPIRFLEASLAVSRSTSPTSFGQVQSSDSVSGSLRYTLTALSSASLSTSYSSVSGIGTFNSWNAVASYSHRLAQGLQSSLFYRYVQRDGTLSARSNSLTLVLTKDVTVLP